MSAMIWSLSSFALIADGLGACGVVVGMVTGFACVFCVFCTLVSLGYSFSSKLKEHLGA